MPAKHYSWGKVFNVRQFDRAGPDGCPFCGWLTLEERGGNEFCSVCFWEDAGQA